MDPDPMDPHAVDMAPLSGFVVGVTADRRSSEQIELLRRRGATCIHAPTIATHPLTSGAELERATEAIIADPVDIVVALTAIGVRAWFEAVSGADLDTGLRAACERADIYVRGQKAAGALANEGLEPGWVSAAALSSDLVQELASRGVAGKRIAVQLDGSQSAEIVSQLRGLGASVIPVPIYHWSLPDDGEPARSLVRAVADGRIDAVTFTARPAVENFVTIAESLDLGAEIAAAFSSSVTAIGVGPVVAEACRRAGMASVLSPARYRLGSMIHLMSACFGERRVDLHVAGCALVSQGSSVHVAGHGVVTLSDLERRLFQALAHRPGTVHSKQQLLASVWAGSTADAHAVEVTIARLRQRLGPAGGGIETVFRRGYRLSAN